MRRLVRRRRASGQCRKQRENDDAKELHGAISMHVGDDLYEAKAAGRNTYRVAEEEKAA
jgi:hypothetical protein